MKDTINIPLNLKYNEGRQINKQMPNFHLSFFPPSTPTSYSAYKTFKTVNQLRNMQQVEWRKGKEGRAESVCHHLTDNGQTENMCTMLSATLVVSVVSQSSNPHG